MAVPGMEHIESIADVIRLAVAPVFLLSGIAALLNVLTNRLSRIVDRARHLELEFPAALPARMETLRQSLGRLARRARLVSWGISLCTGSAILISVVVVVLFIDSLSGVNFSAFIAALFIVAMAALTLGLICFLREISLATRHLRIGEPEPEHSPASASVIDPGPGRQ
ncbi:MAG: DUF2721 domain-containing protein [Nevskia sp.]|nr:DUF2721 domain-containing protein [Nevskia sp.]